MAKSSKFKLVDAFTTKPLNGNPCAVVYCSSQYSQEQMQAIAKEMNQSETAFLFDSQTCTLAARFFTPEREIPLAGHPTIASVHASIEWDILKLNQHLTDITIDLKDGPIEVQIEKTSIGNLVRMFQRKPQFLQIHEPSRVLPLFGLTENDLYPNSVIQTVSTGTRQLMICVKSHDALKRISMKVEQYKQYREKMNFFSPHLFALGGLTPEAQTFARHPGVPPDTMEDSFTGSATGAMAAYLWKYGFLKEPKFIAEQGDWMGRPGRAFVEVEGDRENIETVSVAGHAVTVVSGKLRI